MIFGIFIFKKHAGAMGPAPLLGFVCLCVCAGLRGASACVEEEFEGQRTSNDRDINYKQN